MQLNSEQGPYTGICPEGDVALFFSSRGGGRLRTMLGPAQPLKIIDFTDSGGGGLSPFSIPPYAFDNNKTDPLNLSNISVSNKKRPRNFLENLYFPTHLQVIYRSFTGHLQVIYRSFTGH